MWREAAAQRGRERASEGDRVTLDRDVDVEALLAEKDVAKRSAHEIDALGAVTQRGDCFDDRLQLVERAKLVGETRSLRDGSGLHAFEHAKQIGAADHADRLVVPKHRRGRPRRS